MNLKDALKEIIPSSDLKQLTKSFDIVGDIAVTIIPDGLQQHELKIAQALLSIHKNVKVVLKRDGNYSGEHRTIPLAYLAGEKRTETLCREFGVRLLLDLQKVYFSVRSGTERKRVADLVQPGDNVLVMFSGIAPYPLMISKHSRAATITGIEINEFAHSYAVKNLRLNKVSNISLINDDVIPAIDDTGGKYHRIIMPLPTSSGAYLDCALRALVPNGTIHFYDFKCSCNFETAATLIISKAELRGRKVVSSKIVVCGHISPQRYRICVDAVIE